MGLSQLQRLDKNIYQRNENFKMFLEKINENYFIKTLSWKDQVTMLLFNIKT